MQVRALVRAAHPGPALAVTVVAALLAGAASLRADTVALVALAVLAGQLVIGWSNDLVDVHRDAQVGRADKPLATGEVMLPTARAALGVAGLAAVVFSLALGARAAAVHLLLVVGGGLAYNLRLKSTRSSWLPYAVAFGSLPAVVTLAQSPAVWPPWWAAAAGALLGVGAHFLNVLPDLAEDAATGVHGLPHRLGRGLSQGVATAVLVAASATVVLGPAGPPETLAWAALGSSVVLAAVALLGHGRAPFRAAIGIALVNVAMLTAAGVGGS